VESSKLIDATTKLYLGLKLLISINNLLTPLSYSKEIQSSLKYTLDIFTYLLEILESTGKKILSEDEIFKSFTVNVAIVKDLSEKYRNQIDKMKEVVIDLNQPSSSDSKDLIGEVIATLTSVIESINFEKKSYGDPSTLISHSQSLSSMHEQISKEIKEK
jgi:hypothetical protein